MSLLGVVCIAALIIVPVPTAVVDALITLNLAVAVVLLLAALSARSVRSLSALPGLLLLTTLFRLALNVSTTRLILVQADAGGVVRAFGEFVVAGSYVVGGVVFAILTIVQYVVVASGAGRVAEVAARFALDALPGAQAAIDADLRSGAIGRPEAERRRRELTTESRLFGALDGAMRFVRGDAVASLVITAVNLLGGIAVGAATHGMAASEALKTYGLLTIGDGLAAQIPAVLISVAAGLAVTRVDDPQSPGALPEAAARQLGRTPTHITAAGGLLLALGLVPGLPTAPFVAMGLGAAVVGLILARAEDASAASGAFPLGTGRPNDARRRGLGAPGRLEAEVGPDLLTCLGGADSACALVESAARAACAPACWPAPPIAIAPRDGLGPDAWRLSLDGAPLAQGVIDPSRPDRAAQTLAAAVRRTVASVLPELVDLQTVSDLVDALAETHPALVQAAEREGLDLPTLTRLTSRLASESLPAGDLRAVLDAALALGPPAGPAAPQDRVRRWAEGLRPRFRRHLTALALQGREARVAEAYTLDEALLFGFEEAARRGATPTPVLADELNAACLAAFGGSPPAAHRPRPLLFVPGALRASVRDALGGAWADVLVLRKGDLDPTTIIEPAGELSAGADSAPASTAAPTT